MVSDVDGIRNDNGVGLGINGLLAEVVLEVDTSAEAFFGAETPRVSSTGFIVDEYREYKRDMRGGVIVEGSVEVLPRLYLWIENRLYKKVEGELGMTQKMVQHVVWEVGSNSGKDGKKVGLEGLDGPFSIIATMFVRRDNLEVYLLVLFH